MPKDVETIFLRTRIYDCVDTERASHVEDVLGEDESEFLWLVTVGNLKEIKALLQSKPHLNVDCCDYRGQRALDIAVSTRDIELVEFLVDYLKVTTIHYYGAVLRAVLENEANILELLLNRAEENSRIHGRLRELLEGGQECTKCLPEVAVSNLTPTMAAATRGVVDITRMLVERGYCVHKPHSPKCRCSDYCTRRAQRGDTLTDSMNRMNAYRALASPTYLILTSEDPILAAFELSNEMEKLSRELPENQKEYRELSSQCSKFAAGILHQCRNTEEVQTVLIQKKGLKDPRPHRFSRLHLAVQREQKEFVTHPSCQQVLRSMWVESLGSWYSWSFRWRAFHVMKHACLTPFVCLAFIFIPRAEVIGPLRVPLNRFIYSAASYIFFLCLLMATLLNDRRFTVQSPMTWTEMAVCCYVVGHSWDIFTNLISVGVANYFRSWWCVFDLVMFSLFLTADIMWFSVFSFNMISDDKSVISNRMSWVWFHPILLGEGIYAAASVMAFCRLVMWFQVNSRLGPLGTSVKYMLIDISRFFTLFFIIILAFATGINSIYKNYKDSYRIIEGEVEEQPDAFLTLPNTFKNLFWAIFGMGEPDYAQVIVGRNASINDTIDAKAHSEHLFTEGIGYTLWGLYHMVTVVVLLNMLIAMMTESYQRVQTNADMEWKFACSTLWLSVFDNHSVVPPPYNLIPSMHRMTLVFRWLVASFTKTFDESPRKLSWSSKRCCYWEAEMDHASRKSEEEKYEKLMVQLIRRYLHCDSRQPTTTLSPCVTVEFKEKLKAELIQEMNRSTKLRSRKYTRRRPTAATDPSSQSPQKQITLQVTN